MRRVELIEAGDAEESHGGGDFVFQQFEDSYQAGLTRRRQSPALKFADGHGLRAERDGFQRVAAARDAAVDHDLGSAADRSDVGGRYAIVQDTGAQSAGMPVPGQSSQTMRFKMGDTFEGFSLSQIQDKNVVFTNGAVRVELALDDFRKVEASAPVAGPTVQTGPARPAAAGSPPSPVPLPRVVPQLPRRERLPVPPTS